MKTKFSADAFTELPCRIDDYKNDFLQAARETLIEIAKERNISKRQMALRGDVAPSTMTDLLTHDALPSFSTLIGIIRGGLNMKLSEFFTAVEAKTDAIPAAGEPGGEPSVLPILVEKICAMPEESRVRMLGYATAEESRQGKQ